MARFDNKVVLVSGGARGQGAADNRRGRRGAGFDQAGPIAPDQVTGRDPLITGHFGINLEHAMAQVRDIDRPDGRRVSRARSQVVTHQTIVPDRGGGEDPWISC